MRRLMVMVSLLVLLSMACTFNVQTFAPTSEVPTQSQPEMQTEVPNPSSPQTLEGPDINYNGIRFTLDPALGARLYVLEDEISIDGKTAHNIRFALTPEEYCQTWCLMVYPVAEFEQAFGTFVFPPAGYRGGAAIIFDAQVKALSFQNGSGERSLETFGQSQYGVSNESLKYVFRGYSTDKQYAIYVQVPIHAANLPNVAPTMEFNSQDVLDYNQKEAESMNALTNADFTPDLGLLDALVASIDVGAAR
jgi:hypothetical protein